VSRVVVVGSINMDVVATTRRHPAVGETVLGDDLRFVPGGKGSNQAVAAARLEAPTTLIGRVGRDDFGDTLVDFLAAQGVDVSGVTRAGDGVPTGTALIVVDERSANTIVVVPGANTLVVAPDVVDAADVLVVQLEIPLPVVEAALRLGGESGARTILNAAPAMAASPELLDLADFIVVNELEVASLTGQPVPSGPAGAATLASSLRSRDDQVVVVTLGPAGAVAVTNDGVVVTVPGRAVTAIDSTGAGDCFVGALAAAVASGTGLSDGLRFANAAASLSVQRFGAGTGMPSLAEVRAVLAGTP